MEQATNLTNLWPEPGPCRWEGSVIITMPSLLSVSNIRHIKFPLITQQNNVLIKQGIKNLQTTEYRATHFHIIG